MSAAIDFPVYDADHHLYEPEDAFTRHLPASHKNLFRFVEINGRKRLLIRNVLIEAIPNPTFEVVARPGAHMAFYSGTNEDGKSLRELTGEPIECPPAFRSPAPRIELLDEQGIQGCLLFPTLAGLVEERLIDDPELTQVAISAFNQWLFDEWTYDYQGRIFAAPVVNPCLPDQGIAELERAIDRGARVVLLRPAPVSGYRGTRSPFLPDFDPFWARVQEANVVVALHASDSGYQRYLSTWEGANNEFSPFKPRTFAMVADDGSVGGRSIQDALASAICHGMLTRFPGVRLISVENGAGWVSHFVKNLDSTYKKMPNEFAEHPRDVLQRNVWINPFWEESVASLVDLIGAERVVFGSDYPHAECIADPVSWHDTVTDLPAADVERMMSTNFKDLIAL